MSRPKYTPPSDGTLPKSMTGLKAHCQWLMTEEERLMWVFSDDLEIQQINKEIEKLQERREKREEEVKASRKGFLADIRLGRKKAGDAVRKLQKNILTFPDGRSRVSA